MNENVTKMAKKAMMKADNNNNQQTTTTTKRERERERKGIEKKKRKGKRRKKKGIGDRPDLRSQIGPLSIFATSRELYCYC